MIKKTVFLITISVLSSSFILRNKSYIPPGTIQITENFFADETEITNFSWLEYEWWTIRKYGYRSPEHIAVLPDTLVWRHARTQNEPYVKYYYRHVAYRNYPVVGISYEQVTAFCKWRTQEVKEMYYLKTKKALNIEYRLPTKEEWEFLSNNGAGVFGAKGDGKNEKGQMQLNIIRDKKDTLGSPSVMSDNADITAPVYSYWKNYFGLWCMFGNVAEMVAEKGIAKGGSWIHRLEECRAGKNINYDAPKAWLGFRCVCELNNNSGQMK